MILPIKQFKKILPNWIIIFYFFITSNSFRNELNRLNKKKNVIKKYLSKFLSLPNLIEKRQPRLIITLTSYPARMQGLELVLGSLFMQTLLPDKIILWLSIQEYPEKEKNISKKILKFKNKGLEIEFCDNIKSYKKLIPTLKKYPNDILITVDDDTLYDSSWLSSLYTSYEKNKDFVQCHRATQITMNDNGNLNPYEKWTELVNSNPSYFNFATGVGGILYPVNIFFSDILQEKLFMMLAPHADDIWFWAMTVLNDKKIMLVENNIPDPIDLGINKNWDKLITTNRIQNDIQLKNVLDYYPEIMMKLKKSLT